MEIRQILAVLDGGDRSELALKAAVAVGKALSAHVEVLHVEPLVDMALPAIGEGVTAGAAASVMEAAERDAKKRTEKAEALFQQLCVEAGLAIVDADVPDCPSGACFSWRLASGHDNPEIAHRGRLSDLIVMARADVEDGGVDSTLLEAALFDTGRPVLIAGENRDYDDRRLVVAWDGSRESAHSIGLALPFLVRAEEVRIFAIGDDEPTADPAPLVQYLARHGIEAEAAVIERKGRTIAETLLDEAEQQDTDLLVMGAYGHSAFSEYLFGGVTRTILEEATVPVIMAH